MPAAKCAICGKTAYPLESINAADKVYHKACFKCASCRITLNVNSFLAHDGKVYCKLHVPKASATAVTDTVALRQAKAAPRRTAEGLGNVQKGTGDRPTAVTDSVAMRQAKAAPHRTAEGLGTVQKGTGGKPQTVVFGAGGAPAEQGGYEEQQTYEEAPAEQGYEEQGYEAPAEQGYEEQTYEEAPAEQSYEGYEEAPAEQGYEEQGYAEQGYEEQGYDQGYAEQGYEEQGYDQGYEQQGEGESW